MFAMKLTTPLALTRERIATPLGTLTLLLDAQDRVRALDWDDYEERLQRLLRLHYGAAGVSIEPRSVASEANRQVQAYFAGEMAALQGIAVETGGTAFQRQVWQALRTIAPGDTVSYGHLAQRIGRPNAVRAVGLANGANPIGIIVPCHRVIGANAALTGYAAGIERKQWLLAHERRHSGQPQLF